MAKRLLNRYGWWVLSVLLAIGFLSGFFLLPDAHGGKIVEPIEEPAFDTDLYKSMLSKLVTDETELVDQFNADYLMCYPLMPPAPDWQLVMEGGVIPYDKASFPASWFLDELTPTSDMGVSCYSIVLWLDPVTWQTVVFDEITMKEVTALSVPVGFNMLDFITAAWGEGILYGVDKEWVLSAYSPSRMAFRYRLFEKDDVDDLVAEYSAAAAVTSLASAPVKSAPATMKSSSSSMEISAIEKTASGMEITIELPDGWSPTNSIDVFNTADLVSYWWNLLGTTNGSNTVTYTDTSSGDSDVELRFYRVGDGETDTDSDGYVDAREQLMYHSDPDDEDSYPVTVSGTVTHSNTPQSGTIHVVAVTASNSWDLGRFDDLSSPGSFEITGIPNLDDYWIKAWRDWCDNDQVDPWEATGTATNCPIYLTNSVSNIVITLTDPAASISGTLSYTGKQEGAWIAMVTIVSTSWTATVSDEASGAGFYHLPNLSQTSYYVKAWIDSNGDDACNTNSEANSSWTNNPISLSNSVWDIDFELTDVNGDGDTMPDWWELQHFGNTDQTDSGDYDNDQMPNLWEYIWDFCPTNAADAMWDYDGDGYFNVYEYKHDTDPHNVGSVPSPGSSGGSSQTPSPTVTVVTNGISIQAALDQATNAYDIVVVESGTYSITNDIDFPTNTVMLTSDEGASATILSATDSRLVEFSGSAIGSHTALQGFTLTGGGDVNDGAGIRCDNGASPTIVSCVVSNCAADDDGGGFFCDASSPELRDCVFTDNSAADKGGGVYCKGGSAAVFTNCWVIGNTATDHGGGIYYTDSSGMVLSCSISTNTAAKDGGGIYCDGGSPALQSCYLLGNLAQDDGGGIRTTNDAMTLTSCTLDGNTAYDHGGGFYGNDSDAILSGCVVSENTAVDGGGVGFNGSALTIERCAIVDNWAHVDGGGIRAKDSTPVIRGCLIARNRAFGHGGGVQAKGSTATVVLESCTVADNESRLSGGGVSATESATASATNTVVWGNLPDQLSGASGLSHSCIQGGATGTSIVTNDPAMTPYWFRLKTGSSSTNAGTNATWMTSAYDIDGEARITNTVVDIGVDEFYDSDADGMSDAWELYYFGDLSMDGTADSDGDELDDAGEYAYDGDPTDTDTDGDGFEDGDEVASGMSVASADDPDTLTLEYRFGDAVGASGSEKYVLTIVNTTNATDKVCVTNTAFGSELTGNYDFTKGAEYEITVDHYDSDTNWPTVPDYDYQVYIQDEGGTTGWSFGPGFALCDTNGILGDHWENGETTTFDATNRSAQLYIPLIDLTLHKPKVIDTNAPAIPDDDEFVEGAMTFPNLDNDDADEYFDKDDDEIGVGSGYCDDEFVKAELVLSPRTLPTNVVKLVALQGAADIDVWESEDKISGEYTLGDDFALTDDGTNLVGTLWLEGLNAHTVQRQTRVKLYYPVAGTDCCDVAALTIVGVSNLTWEGHGNGYDAAAGNFDSDTLDTNDPNYTGSGMTSYRVFAGARAPAYATPRNTVTLRVELTVTPIEDLSIQLMSFDVDDPSPETTYIDPNDTGGAGNYYGASNAWCNLAYTAEEDNRGSVASSGTDHKSGVLDGQAASAVCSLTVPSTGTAAEVEFETSLFCGDNYRAVASGDADFLTGLRNRDADDGFYIVDPDVGSGSTGEVLQSENYVSDCLTIWRILHVECDSMEAVPTTGDERNTVSGYVDRIFSTYADLDTDLADLPNGEDDSNNLDSGTTGNGRFEGGEITIGSGTGSPSPVTVSVSANGTNRVNCSLSATVPYQAAKSGGGGIVSGYVDSFYRSDRKVFLDGTGLGSSYNDYDGGTINIAGVGLSISNAVSAYQLYVSGDPQIQFRLEDDDSESLPAEIDLSWFDRLAPAYIAHTNDGGGGDYNNDDVEFKLNIAEGQLASSFNDGRGSTNCEKIAFWVGYLGAAWQPDFAHDDDPGAEGETMGRAWACVDSATEVDRGAEGGVVFVETVADCGVAGGLSRSAIHEMGHQFGLKDATGGLMTYPGGGDAFEDVHVHFIRCRESSPGTY